MFNLPYDFSKFVSDSKVVKANSFQMIDGQFIYTVTVSDVKEFTEYLIANGIDAMDIKVKLVYDMKQVIVNATNYIQNKGF